MNKFLLVVNLVLLCAVIFLATRYRAERRPVLTETDEIYHAKNADEPDCRYSLEAFDFHYRKETDKPNIIMFGNSLIRRGDWPKLLGREDLINRGIGGDNMECLAHRIAYLGNIDAKVWVMEGGINDFPMKKPGELLGSYKRILDYVRGRGAKPILSLVIHLSPKAADSFENRKDYLSINKSIDELNSALRGYAESIGVAYIDPNEKLCDPAGLLRDDCTVDGLHLSPKGYKIWAEQIKAALQSLNI